jgi:hypothetical protein
VGKDMREARNTVTGNQLACGVVGSINVGKKRGGTSSDGIGEERRGVLVCDTRDMVPRSGIHPDQVPD